MMAGSLMWGVCKELIARGLSGSDWDTGRKSENSRYLLSMKMAYSHSVDEGGGSHLDAILMVNIPTKDGIKVLNFRRETWQSHRHADVRMAEKLSKLLVKDLETTLKKLDPVP